MAMPGKTDGKMGAGAGCGAGRGGAAAAEWMRGWGGAGAACLGDGGDVRVRDFVRGDRGGVTPDGRRLLIWRAMLLRGVVESKVSRANRKMEQQA